MGLKMLYYLFDFMILFFHLLHLQLQRSCWVTNKPETYELLIRVDLRLTHAKGESNLHFLICTSGLLVEEKDASLYEDKQRCSSADVRGKRLSRVHEINMLLVIAFSIGFTAVSQRRRERARWVDAKRMKENCRKKLLIRKTSQYS